MNVSTSRTSGNGSGSGLSPTTRMLLPDPLPIQPFGRPVSGAAHLPGSKSLTNRALLLSALCDKPVTLTNALFSDDTRLMADALRALGIPVAENASARTLRVEGHGGYLPRERADLYVGNAGTAARFLTALCAASQRGTYVIDGSPQMRVRPMAGLIEALRASGARIKCLREEGFLPISIEAHGLTGGMLEINASESSQMLSALLMVAPLARKPMKIRPETEMRLSFVEMTSRLMEEFGGTGLNALKAEGIYETELIAYRSPGVYAIEPDASAASYFMALPLVTGGKVSLPNLHLGFRSLQGDTRFAEIVRMAGGSVEEVQRKGQPMAVESEFNLLSHRPRGVDADFEEFSDTFLTFAAISPLLDRTTVITGIGHTRRQETDRVAGMARELRKLGQNVLEDEDALTITPRPILKDIVIDTYEDHRFAMSFAILGCCDLRGDGRPWLKIRNPACCAKTFPGFFDLLEELRKESQS